MIELTPGPWSLLPARTLVNVKGPRGEQICQLRKEAEANAKLIAAAPEVAAECDRLKALVTELVGVMESHWIEVHDYDWREGTYYPAIAKAKAATDMEGE